MKKILFDFYIGSDHITISSYRFFLIASVFVVLGGSFYLTLKQKISPYKILILLLASSIFMLFGARLSNYISNNDAFTLNDQKFFALEFSNFDLFGGLIFTAIFSLMICAIFKLDVWKTADAIVPTLGLGIITLRVGCFLNACCIGKPTNLPWGISIPLDQSKYSDTLSSLFSILPEESLPLHPTQIYEIVGVALLLIFTFFIYKLSLKTGTAALVFCIGYSCIRLINENFREITEYSSMPHYYALLLFSLSILILSIILFLRYKFIK